MSQLLSVNVGLPRDIELLTFGGWPLLAQSCRSQECPLLGEQRKTLLALQFSAVDPTETLVVARFAVMHNKRRRGCANVSGARISAGGEAP
jgi:hypothetical protein